MHERGGGGGGGGGGGEAQTLVEQLKGCLDILNF